ncbi:MAG: FG-GAP-like repeat-containing protein [Vicinamibacterales bacterium]
MRAVPPALLVALSLVTASAWVLPAPWAEAPGVWGAVVAAGAGLQAAPQPPASLTVTGVKGRSVSLTWTPPASGPSPTGYIVQGGFHPGEVLGSLPTGVITGLTLDAPPTVVYLRVRAVAGNDVSSPSAEVRVAVGEFEPPSAPAGLQGLADGTSVTLAWTNTYAGGTPARLWLEVSGAATTRVPLGLANAFAAGDVPLGTYTLQVVAENAAGRSAPSNPVTLAIPSACTAAPGPPRNLRSTRSGATLLVEWDPPATGELATSYTLLVSGSVVATVDTTTRQVSGPVPPGNYIVQVAARNACGQSTPMPSAAPWTAVVRQGADHVVHFPPMTGVSGYRVFWSTSRQDLDAFGPGVGVAETSGSPLTLPVQNPDLPLYYRVTGAYGQVSGPGGPIALAPAFDVVDAGGWPSPVTAALADLDGDGCLDLVGGWGRCDGTFDVYDLASVGLQALMIDPTKARDSRIADFTGDGIPDIFTNVYTRADDTTVRATLHVGNGNRTFTENQAFAPFELRGFGETVLAADFDNDGDVDIFVPQYTHRDDGGRNYLLLNDGAAHFVERAAAAGVDYNDHTIPEGAQALDFDGDGWIDISVDSHIYRNNGDGTFSDIGPSMSLPIRFDEGMRLLDVDLDGDFDYVHHDAFETRLFVNNGGTFDQGTVIDGLPDGSTYGYGINVCDFNGDGFEDVIVAHNDAVSGTGLPRLLVNAGGRFVRSDLPPFSPRYNDLKACVDIDGSGLPDIVSRISTGTSGFRRLMTRGAPAGTITVRAEGMLGQKNQQGRLVRIRPLAQPLATLLRVVEGGSGYMSQNGYDLVVPTSWAGDHEVAVRFKTGWVTTTARPGDVLTIREDGTILTGLQ